MAEIIVFDGYVVPKFKRSTKPGSKKTMSKHSHRTKFKRVAKVCGKKKGKAAKKACWRKHFPKR